jgi:hypothetical protein
MAIYHLTTKVFSRGKGQSAIAAAAYRSGERLVDEAMGVQKFYTARAERIEFQGMFVPANSPEWAHDRNAFWNRAEQAENRFDARLAREIEIALPHELTEEQRLRLVKDFVREQFVRKGYGADVAIHAPDNYSDERNHHAHILISERRLGPDGFAEKKDPTMNGKAQLATWREQWANLANRHLERYGHEARIDHRSLFEQKIDREPGIHLGHAASEIMRRGGESERVIQLADIRTANAERAAVKGEIRELDRELQGLEQEQAAERKAEEKRQREEAEQEAARKAEEQRRREQAAQLEAQEARQRESEAKEPARKAEIERQEIAQQDVARKAVIDPEQAAQREAARQAATQAEEARKIEIARVVAEEMIAGLNGRPPSAEDIRKAAEIANDRLAQANAAAAKEPAKQAEKATPAPAPAPTPEPQRGAAEKTPAQPRPDNKAQKAAEIPARVAAAPDPHQAAAQAALERSARATSPVQREPVAKSPAPAAPIYNPPTVNPREVARTATNAAVSSGKTLARGGLMVADKVSGKVMGLADFVTDFLGGSSRSERPQVEQNRASAAAFLNHPQGRMQRQMEQLAQEQRAQLAERAWETIREDMQAGRALKAEEVRNLPRQALEQIRQFGDEGVRQMVQEAEKRAERYWKGEERERERDW